MFAAVATSAEKVRDDDHVVVKEKPTVGARRQRQVDSSSLSVFAVVCAIARSRQKLQNDASRIQSYLPVGDGGL